MKKYWFVPPAILTLLLVFACVQVTPEPTMSTEPNNAYARHVSLAQEYEKSGDFKRAIEEWEIARLLYPENREVLDSIARLQQTTRIKAEEAYQKGEAAWKKGLHKTARAYFLTALRLDPDRREILTKFFEKPLERKGVVVHRVGPGETLSLIAKKYYGDLKDYHFLAEYNMIRDPSKLEVGQQIIVPGVTKQVVEPQTAKQQSEKKENVVSSEIPATSEYTSPIDASDYPIEQIPTEEVTTSYDHVIQLEESQTTELHYARAFDLFKREDFTAAAFEFKKVINVSPNYKDALEYYKESRYLAGRKAFQEGRIELAYESFKEVFAMDPTYRETSKFMNLSEEKVKDWHYRRGIQLYRQEKLREALQEWQIVHKIDPGYKKISYYIQRCKQILEKLQEIKSSDS